MAVEVSIIGVTSCECPGHARVVLRDEAGGRKLQVRVTLDAGQAMLAEMTGMASTHAGAIDLLRNAVEAAGGCIEHLTLGCRRGQLCARLGVRSADGLAEIDADPCEGLLTACRMHIPVFVEEAGPNEIIGPDVPEIYREFVESLDLTGIEEQD